MNRTARCIRMLMILKSRESVCTAELAELLETNPRNIREYKKELEEAGFRVETIRGAGGGYKLEHSALLPLPIYDDGALDVFRTMRDSLLSSPNLPYAKRGVELLEAIIASNPTSDIEQPIYFTPSRKSDFPDEGMDYLTQVRRAIVQNRQIEIVYHSKANQAPVIRVVDPYEVLCADGKWYFCGYDHYREDYRTFKFSPKRLLDLRVLDSEFERNPKFKLRDYIGVSGLTREDTEFYLVEVAKDDARFFEEVKWGSSFAKVGEQREGWITYSFFSDDPDYIQRTLFRLGASARILTPRRRANQYRNKLRAIEKCYEEADDTYE